MKIAINTAESVCPCCNKSHCGINEMSMEFQIAGSLEGLEELQKRLEQLARSWGLSNKALFELNLVLEELCSNYIEHSGETSKGKVNIKLCRTSSEFVITISDSGPPFDPTITPSPDVKLPLAERQCGGLGLHFVRHFTDGIMYSREKSQNIVTIIKKIEGEPQG
jgi:anti-sigma regulatory factor (Ser/Thr protein kinase)